MIIFQFFSVTTCLIFNTCFKIYINDNLSHVQYLIYRFIMIIKIIENYKIDSIGI